MAFASIIIPKAAAEPLEPNWHSRLCRTKSIFACEADMNRNYPEKSAKCEVAVAPLIDWLLLGTLIVGTALALLTPLHYLV
jgi:hypothetical protein